MYYLGQLFLVIIIGFFFLAGWMRSAFASSSYAKDPNSIFSYKLGGGSGFAVVLLFLALVGLGERILYDLSRTIVGSGYDYVDSFPTIMVHAGFILLVLVIFTVLNVVMSEKKQKYAVALVPYFMFSILLALQLVLEISVYFYNHHTQLQFYTLMSLLVLVSSVGIYLIQERYAPPSLE